MKFPVVPWTTKKARIAQPDLDYMAPEVQLETASHATTASDMFALGSLICAVYNAGNTPVAASCSVSTYAVHAKQVLDDNDTAPPSRWSQCALHLVVCPSVCLSSSCCPGNLTEKQKAVNCESKKDARILPVTSLNADRFSKFFHWRTH